MVELLCRTTIRYSDGTPQTKHVITNPIIEVNEGEGTATCRSNYVVFQQTDTLVFQAIVAGRYRDKFLRINGEWRFAERDYSLVDMVGDISQHLRMDLKPSEG
jgi:3-phenylpropionate/cinnamic acid dioxygenase small subunit